MFGVGFGQVFVYFEMSVYLQTIQTHTITTKSWYKVSAGFLSPTKPEYVSPEFRNADVCFTDKAPTKDVGGNSGVGAVLGVGLGQFFFISKCRCFHR